LSIKTHRIGEHLKVGMIGGHTIVIRDVTFDKYIALTANDARAVAWLILGESTDAKAGHDN
jgi:hypothetical protein